MSDETRGRLIEAGLELFGTLGFDGASTRALAQTADANLSAIVYHFGGKPGLYNATIDHAAALLTDPIQVDLDRARAIIAAHPEPDEARVALVALVDGVTAITVSEEPDHKRAARFIVREVLSPGATPDPVRYRVMEPLVTCLAGLLARAHGMADADHMIRLQATALVGEMLIFRLFGSEGYGGEECVHTIREALRRNAAAVARDPGPQPG